MCITLMCDACALWFDAHASSEKCINPKISALFMLVHNVGISNNTGPQIESQLRQSYFPRIIWLFLKGQKVSTALVVQVTLAQTIFA